MGTNSYRGFILRGWETWLGEPDQIISCLLCPCPHLSFSPVKRGHNNASSMEGNEVEYIKKNALLKLSLKCPSHLLKPFWFSGTKQYWLAFM